MKSVTVTVDDSTVTIWQNLILEQKRLGEISRKTTTNKRMFRAFVQEYIDLKLKRELLERLEITQGRSNLTRLEKLAEMANYKTIHYLHLLT